MPHIESLSVVLLTTLHLPTATAVSEPRHTGLSLLGYVEVKQKFNHRLYH